jgi:hypothetical protein
MPLISIRNCIYVCYSWKEAKCCKVKVKLFLYLIIQLSTMPRMHMGSRGIAPPFLTLGLDGGERPASCPPHFTSGDRVLGTLYIGGSEGFRVGLDAMEKRKISSPVGYHTHLSRL